MDKKKKRQQAVQRQQEILNAAKTANRELSAEEKAEFDSIQREIETLNAEIAEEERQAADGQSSIPGAAGGTLGQEDLQQVRQQERNRISEISTLCREFGMNDQLQGFIEGGNTVESVRAAVIERMRENGAPLNGRVTVETDEQDKFRDAASDALLLRGGVRLEKPAAGARELMGLTLRDLAIECLVAEGQTGMNRRSSDELFTIMQRQFTMTRQAFINDDVDMITRMPAKYAASARKTQNKQCYQILVNNPAIYDGVKVFDKAHVNLLAKGTGITREAVQGMILALSNQKDEFGEVCIIRPATIIVPSGYQFDMYTLFFSPTINTTDNTQAVNPLYQYRESIQVVEDPTINVMCGGFGNQMPWWLLGAKEDTDFMEIDYLNGQDVPNIRRAEVPGTLGYVWDIYLDWGITVMDYRGAIKNPGVVVKNPIELA